MTSPLAATGRLAAGDAFSLGVSLAPDAVEGPFMVQAGKLQIAQVQKECACLDFGPWGARQGCGWVAVGSILARNLRLKKLRQLFWEK